MQFDTSHYGEYKQNAENFGYNAIVITGPIMGKKDVEFGRVVQVRKKSGAYGSDTVLLRRADSSLHSYHNMGFFSVSKDYLPLYEEAMKECDDKKLDTGDNTYNIMGNNAVKGFVVEGLDDTNGKVHSFAVTTTKEKDGTIKKTITA